MFDLFSDAAKVAAQMEIISSEYGFALWETLYSLALEVLFAYVVFREKLKPKAIVGLCLMAAGTLAMALWA